MKILLNLSEIRRPQFQLCNVLIISYWDKPKKFLTHANQLNLSFKEYPFAVQRLFSRDLPQLYETQFNQLNIWADELGYSSPEFCELSQPAVPLGLCHHPPASCGMMTCGDPCYKDIISGRGGRSSISSHHKPVRPCRVEADPLLMVELMVQVPSPCCQPPLLHPEDIAFNSDRFYDRFYSITLQGSLLPHLGGNNLPQLMWKNFFHQLCCRRDHILHMHCKIKRGAYCCSTH